MSKFLITASVVSAFVIGFVAPASALDIENEDQTEYSINIFSHSPDVVDFKTFKLMPGQSLKGLPCGSSDVCSVQIEDSKNSPWGREAVVATSKMKVKQGRIVRN